MTINPKSDAEVILGALNMALEALQRIPTGHADEYKQELEAAEQALVSATNLVKQEYVEKILGALYQLEYDRDHVLFRVTVEDFADLLADRLVEKGVPLGSLSLEDLGNLVDQAGEYLNGDGIAWVDVINIALDDEWPERLTESEE
jgi:cellobiose-specific phosphotransferase system component IIA